MIDLVVQILQEGIEKTKSAKKNGDPALRLEKHLIRMVSLGRARSQSGLLMGVVLAV